MREYRTLFIGMIPGILAGYAFAASVAYDWPIWPCWVLAGIYLAYHMSWAAVAYVRAGRGGQAS